MINRENLPAFENISADDYKALVLELYPNAKIRVYGQGDVTTCDYWPERVNIVYDRNTMNVVNVHLG